MTRSIVRDLVVSVSGAGWRHHVARLLTTSDGEVAVFIPPKGTGPERTFQLAGEHKDDGAIHTQAGKLLTTEGESVQYRRRGASCSWALAKCNVTSQQLLDEWPEEPDFEPEDGGEVEVQSMEQFVNGEPGETMSQEEFEERGGQPEDNEDAEMESAWVARGDATRLGDPGNGDGL